MGREPLGQFDINGLGEHLLSFLPQYFGENIPHGDW